MIPMSRIIRVGSIALILAVPAFAASAFFVAGSQPSVTGDVAAQETPALFQMATKRSATNVQRSTTISGVETIDLRDFSHTGRPIPSPFKI